MIREQEIETIRKFLNEFSKVSVEQLSLTVNSKVRVKQGILMNYEGILLEVSGSKALVKIDSLGLMLTARFEKKNLEKVNGFMPV